MSLLIQKLLTEKVKKDASIITRGFKGSFETYLLGGIFRNFTFVEAKLCILVTL